MLKTIIQTLFVDYFFPFLDQSISTPLSGAGVTDDDIKDIGKLIFSLKLN